MNEEDPPTPQLLPIPANPPEIAAVVNGETRHHVLKCSLALDRLPRQFRLALTSEKKLISVPLPSSAAATTNGHPPQDEGVAAKVLCLFCDRTFANAKLCEKHRRKVHLTRRTSVRISAVSGYPGCSHCSESPVASFSSHSNDLDGLFQHLVGHHPDRYFACSECNIRTATKVLLLAHQKSQHPDTVIAEVQDAHHEPPVRITRQAMLIQCNQTQSFMGRNEPPTMLSRLGFAQNRSPRTQKGAKNRRGTNSYRTPDAWATANTRSSRNTKLLRSASNLSSESVTNTANATIPSTATIPLPLPGDASLTATVTKSSSSSSSSQQGWASNNGTFEDDFYETVGATVRRNLATCLDGKLEKNEHVTQSVIDSPPSLRSTVVRSPVVADNEIHEASALTAITAFPTLLTAEQYGCDSNSGGGKIKRMFTKNSWKWKWDFVKKYKYVNEGGRMVKKVKEQQLGSRDLTKLDMWTQLTMRTKHEEQRRRDDAAQEPSAPPQVGELARAEKRRLVDELNTILDSRLMPQISVEQNEQRLIKVEMTDEELCEPKVVTTVAMTVPVDDTFPNMLSLQRNPAREPKPELTLSGEWARPRCYVCFCCGHKFDTIKMMEDHKQTEHPHVLSSHYELVGKELIDGDLYQHLFIPAKALGSRGNEKELAKQMREEVDNKMTCTKCKKECMGRFDLYRHLLDCSGDYAWLMAKKRFKYRYYGNRSKRRRTNARLIFGCVRSATSKIVKTERKIKRRKMKSRQKKSGKPSDAETIERMLANLPEKRISRNPTTSTSSPNSKPLKTPQKSSTKKNVPSQRIQTESTATTSSSTAARMPKRNLRSSLEAVATQKVKKAAPKKKSPVKEEKAGCDKVKEKTSKVNKSDANTSPVQLQTRSSAIQTKSPVASNVETLPPQKQSVKDDSSPTTKRKAQTLVKKITKKSKGLIRKIENTVEERKPIVSPPTALTVDTNGGNPFLDKGHTKDSSKTATTEKIPAPQETGKEELEQSSDKVKEDAKPPVEVNNVSVAAEAAKMAPIVVITTSEIVPKSPIAIIPEKDSDEKKDLLAPVDIQSPQLSPSAMSFRSGSTMSPMASPNAGARRRPRKLNDCIARLTDKLQEKLGIPFFTNPVAEPVVLKAATSEDVIAVAKEVIEVEMAVPIIEDVPLNLSMKDQPKPILIDETPSVCEKEAEIIHPRSSTLFEGHCEVMDLSVKDKRHRKNVEIVHIHKPIIEKEQITTTANELNAQPEPELVLPDQGVREEMPAEKEHVPNISPEIVEILPIIIPAAEIMEKKEPMAVVMPIPKDDEMLPNHPKKKAPRRKCLSTEKITSTPITPHLASVEQKNGVIANETHLLIDIPIKTPPAITKRRQSVVASPKKTTKSMIAIEPTPRLGEKLSKSIRSRRSKADKESVTIKKNVTKVGPTKLNMETQIQNSTAGTNGKILPNSGGALATIKEKVFEVKPKLIIPEEPSHVPIVAGVDITLPNGKRSIESEEDPLEYPPINLEESIVTEKHSDIVETPKVKKKRKSELAQILSVQPVISVKNLDFPVSRRRSVSTPIAGIFKTESPKPTPKRRVTKKKVLEKTKTEEGVLAKDSENDMPIDIAATIDQDVKMPEPPQLEAKKRKENVVNYNNSSTGRRRTTNNTKSPNDDESKSNDANLKISQPAVEIKDIKNNPVEIKNSTSQIPLLVKTNRRSKKAIVKEQTTTNNASKMEELESPKPVEIKKPVEKQSIKVTDHRDEIKKEEVIKSESRKKSTKVINENVTNKSKMTLINESNKLEPLIKPNRKRKVASKSKVGETNENVKPIPTAENEIIPDLHSIEKTSSVRQTVDETTTPLNENIVFDKTGMKEVTGETIKKSQEIPIDSLADTEDSLPKKLTTKPKKKRKNELAQIIADQLLESFKEVDKAKKDDLKILHELEDTSKMASAMKLAPVPKRQATARGKVDEKLTLSEESKIISPKSPVVLVPVSTLLQKELDLHDIINPPDQVIINTQSCGDSTGPCPNKGIDTSATPPMCATKSLALSPLFSMETPSIVPMKRVTECELERRLDWVSKASELNNSSGSVKSGNMSDDSISAKLAKPTSFVLKPSRLQAIASPPLLDPFDQLKVGDRSSASSSSFCSPVVSPTGEPQKRLVLNEPKLKVLFPATPDVDPKLTQFRDDHKEVAVSDGDYEDNASDASSDTLESSMTSATKKTQSPRKRRKKSMLTKKKSRNVKLVGEHAAISGEKFHCDICNKTFEKADRLAKHKITLTHISRLSEIEFLNSQKAANDKKEAEEHKEKEIDEVVNEIIEVVSSPEMAKPKSHIPLRSIPEVTSVVPPINVSLTNVQLEPISSPEQQQIGNPIEGNRFCNFGQIRPSPNMSGLSQEEKLFFECCNMLKGSDRIGTQSESKSLTPRSNEAVSTWYSKTTTAFTIRSPNSYRTSPKYAFSKIDLNQFSDISSDSNSMYHPRQTNTVAENPNGASMAGQMTTAPFPTQSSVGQECNSNVQSPDDELPVPVKRTSRVYSDSLSDMGDSFPSSHEPSDNVNYAKTILDRSNNNTNGDYSKFTISSAQFQTSIEDQSTASQTASEQNSLAKVKTKAAMKGFDNLKVSIPTNGLDLEQALVRQNHGGSKLAALADIALSTVANMTAPIMLHSEQVEEFVPISEVSARSSTLDEPPKSIDESCINVLTKPMKAIRQRRTDKNSVGNKLGFKARRRKETQVKKSSVPVKPTKIPPLESQDPLAVYEFEDSQDSAEIPIAPISKHFKGSSESDAAVKEKTADMPEVIDEDVSQLSSDSFSDRDDFNYNGTTLESDISSRDSPQVTAIADTKILPAKKVIDNVQKKSLIMGRIFKKAQKSQKLDSDRSNDDQPDVLLSGAETKVKSTKATPVDVNKLFDSLKECDSRAEPRIEEQHVLDETLKKKKFHNKLSPKVMDVGKDAKRLASPSLKKAKLDLLERPKRGSSLDNELVDALAGQRKSKRKCSQQVNFAETWSSDEYEEFQDTKDIIALIEEKEKRSKKRVFPSSLSKEVSDLKTAPSHAKPSKIQSRRKTIAFKETFEDDVAPSRKEFTRKYSPVRGLEKKKDDKKSTPKLLKRGAGELQRGAADKDVASLTIGGGPRRKRLASEKLYYWSSESSDEETEKTTVEENDGGGELEQHGWIVGDSHKKLVTLLAHAKGKKTEVMPKK